jgi:hypothetical protein
LVGCLRLFAPYFLLIARRLVKKVAMEVSSLISRLAMISKLPSPGLWALAVRVTIELN